MLMIAAGGALGSVGRFLVAELFMALGLTRFPWGTVAANVSGCFVIGLALVLIGPSGRHELSTSWQAFILAGFCGGYTTFSSFSLQTILLLEAGDLPRAFANVLVSVALCLLAVWLGLVLGRVTLLPA